MVCLDTDFMVALLRGNPDALDASEDLPGKREVSTTPINAFEILFGAYRSRRSEENVKAVAALLSNIELLEFNLDAANIAAQTYSALMAEEHGIGVEDTLTAGIVLSHDETLVTRNIDHFSRVKGLKTRRW